MRTGFQAAQRRSHAPFEGDVKRIGLHPEIIPEDRYQGTKIATLVELFSYTDHHRVDGSGVKIHTLWSDVE